MLNVSYLQSSGERALYKVHSKKVHLPTILLPVTKGSWDSKHASFFTCWIHQSVQRWYWLNNARGNQANSGRRYFRLSPGPKSCYLNWRQKQSPFVSFLIQWFILTPASPPFKGFLKCYVPLFVFSVSVPNGKLRALLVKGFHVHVNVCLKWHQLDMT